MNFDSTWPKAEPTRLFVLPLRCDSMLGAVLTVRCALGVTPAACRGGIELEGGFPWKRAPQWPTERANHDDLITHTVPLEDINRAFDLMHAGESIRSVVVF